MKTIIILGNGFDVDAGLKTKYSDFLSSPVFSNYLTLEREENRGIFASRNDIKTYGLLHFINEKFHSDKWCDLEGLLYTYAKNDREQIVLSGKLLSQQNVSDKNRALMFHVLVNALLAYLNSLDYSLVGRNICG